MRHYFVPVTYFCLEFYLFLEAVILIPYNTIYIMD